MANGKGINIGLTGPISTIIGKSIDLARAIVELRIEMLKVLSAERAASTVELWLKSEERFERFLDQTESLFRPFIEEQENPRDSKKSLRQ